MSVKMKAAITLRTDNSAEGEALEKAMRARGVQFNKVSATEIIYETALGTLYGFRDIAAYLLPEARTFLPESHPWFLSRSNFQTVQP